ncbi:unnamed protein product [Kuraishia capsulata CBS 1993]|uniref:Uncharacterized protein n=1 Tax=Kuraishia capsulata CBS 1993 TaxID=1382522 RepID=W6MIW8_9ASCO|nr:uncharacterized protein KUCA_T00002416001 [Kuraishia capsulata CBS 1993]CDK26444.1 unnamed protein product [Kuraishia capsulata CBS 1993]
MHGYVCTLSICTGAHASRKSENVWHAVATAIIPNLLASPADQSGSGLWTLHKTVFPTIPPGCVLASYFPRGRLSLSNAWRTSQQLERKPSTGIGLLATRSKNVFLFPNTDCIRASIVYLQNRCSVGPSEIPLSALVPASGMHAAYSIIKATALVRIRSYRLHYYFLSSCFTCARQ